MATVNRSTLINGMAQDLAINQAREITPTQLKPDIQPTFDICQKIATVIKHYSGSASGTQTIYTTPSDKDFYLTAFMFAVIKDAACDTATNGSIGLNCIVGGATVALAKLPVITLTAQTSNLACGLPFPLKLDRGTIISFTGTAGAGVLVRTATIQGFILE